MSTVRPLSELMAMQEDELDIEVERLLFKNDLSQPARKFSTDRSLAPQMWDELKKQKRWSQYSFDLGDILRLQGLDQKIEYLTASLADQCRAVITNMESFTDLVERGWYAASP